MARQTDDYKTMMHELQELLDDMQAEDLDVDVALQKYKRGQELIVALEKYLKTAENKVVQHKLRKGEQAE